MNINLQSTADGSPTLYLPDLDEHYHSVKGALAESLHVYVDCGWRHRASSLPETRPLRVFEVGFGTGLNAALTAQAALTEAIPTQYFSIELHPLRAPLTRQLLDSQPALLRPYFDAVNSAPWGLPVEVNPRFTLTKINADLLTTSLPDAIDVVYFDAFAPEKQPEMWSPEIFSRLFAAMAPASVLTTYCAKGHIRRLLAAIGFTPQRLPGPPAGKREILRALHP